MFNSHILEKGSSVTYLGSELLMNGRIGTVADVRVLPDGTDEVTVFWEGIESPFAYIGSRITKCLCNANDSSCS